MSKILNFVDKSDKFFFLPIFISVASIFFILILFAMTYNSLPPKLPMFYSLTWGSSQLVDKQQFLILPAVIVLTVLINLFLAWELHPVQYVLKRILMLNILLIDLIVLITALKILSIFF